LCQSDTEGLLGSCQICQDDYHTSNTELPAFRYLDSIYVAMLDWLTCLVYVVLDAFDLARLLHDALHHPHTYQEHAMVLGLVVGTKADCTKLQKEPLVAIPLVVLAELRLELPYCLPDMGEVEVRRAVEACLATQHPLTMLMLRPFRVRGVPLMTPTELPNFHAEDSAHS